MTIALDASSLNASDFSPQNLPVCIALQVAIRNGFPILLKSLAL
jgi:hypothetical protein